MDKEKYLIELREIALDFVAESNHLKATYFCLLYWALQSDFDCKRPHLGWTFFDAIQSELEFRGVTNAEVFDTLYDPSESNVRNQIEFWYDYRKAKRDWDVMEFTADEIPHHDEVWEVGEFWRK